MREEDRLTNLEFRQGKGIDLLNVDLNKWLREKATVQIWRFWNRQACRIFYVTFDASQLTSSGVELKISCCTPEVLCFVTLLSVPWHGQRQIVGLCGIPALGTSSVIHLSNEFSRVLQKLAHQHSVTS